MSPIILFTLITVLMGVFAGPVFDYADRAAEQLMNPDGYINAVMGGAD